MSDERESEQAGAPVEETEASPTEVQAAVDRAGDVGLTASEAVAETEAARDEAAAAADDAAETVVVTETVVEAETAVVAEPETVVFPGTERPTIAPADPLPSAAAEPAMPATTVMPESPSRDGEIRISADHPMAALYMQTPMPPTLRGNRGAGVLISLLATAGFAAVYAGVLALLIAPFTPPSRFVGTLVDGLLSWGTVFGVIAFFVGLVILVLIVGRAGWWAYVLGGFLVAVLTWAGVIAGTVFDAEGWRGLFRPDLDEVAIVALSPVAIAALIVAREATVWFGAWIGARGRKMTRSNAEALAEYETALAEVQAKQP